ncbi:hypothetical protein L596_030528 [Steinernema carpocapsae]|uniref:Secreted protein n=1 Tax=Steinernema carpocapsae TaxID=34508 RepID=A0A4U5LPP8_STECR|nr:hypothetical protein L596_030528 [Steinernema carpocapsae]
MNTLVLISSGVRNPRGSKLRVCCFSIVLFVVITSAAKEHAISSVSSNVFQGIPRTLCCIDVALSFSGINVSSS